MELENNRPVPPLARPDPSMFSRSSFTPGGIGLALGVVLNLLLLLLPLWLTRAPEAALDTRLPAWVRPDETVELKGKLQPYTDGLGQPWLLLRPDAASTGKTIARLDPQCFPAGCQIEWFSPDQSALLVRIGDQPAAAEPCYGAVRHGSMQSVQRALFPPDKVKAGLHLGSLLPGEVFFRALPCSVDTYRPFRPAMQNGASWLWQFCVWASALCVIVLLTLRYRHTGRRLFACLALAYAFLLGVLFFEQPYYGMAGIIDLGDDSYYVAYTQNLLSHGNFFREPTHLEVGKSLVEHNHGLPGVALFLAPAVVLESICKEQRPGREPIDLEALRAMRILGALYAFLATLFLFFVLHKAAVSAWNVPLAAFLIWGTSLAKWTYQRVIFTHAIELMLLCLILLLLVQAGPKRPRPLLLGAMLGTLLGLLLLVRGEYLFAVPLIPLLLPSANADPSRRGKLALFAGYGLTLLPCLGFYFWATHQLSTGYGRLTASTMFITGWHDLAAPATWLTVGRHMALLAQSYWESGVVLFAGLALLLWFAHKKRGFPLPIRPVLVFLLLFFVLTALFHTPLGFEWQHRYSLKLYPFALLAVAVWVHQAGKSARWVHAAVGLALGFSLLRQLWSFEHHDDMFTTAKWVLSDVHLATHDLADPRFSGLHAAVIIVLLLWAGAGAAWWWRRIRSWQGRSLTAAALAGLVVTVAFAGHAATGRTPGGLLVTYYRGTNFQQAVAIRSESAINKDYGFARPAWGAPRKAYSARWTGTLIVPESTNYIFYAQAADGFRVWLDGSKLLDNWTHRRWSGSGKAASIFLQAGEHAIAVEHCKEQDSGALRLRWAGGPIPENSIVAAPFLRKQHSPQETPAPTSTSQ